MSESYIDDNIETLVESCIALGETPLEGSSNNYRALVRELEKNSTKIKRYISILEEKFSEEQIQLIIRQCELDE